MTQVLQNGSRQRSFTNDSLSRLLTSLNPEVGTITYTYDPNGNLQTKRDARSITTSYGYDVLNREISRSYSNSDPGITTSYDQSACLGLTTCQNIGHRTSMTDAAGSESWSYDVVNRAHKDQRTTNSITKSTTYNFDYAGNVTSVVYPTSRTVNYAYDTASRPITAIDGSNGITYAAGFKTSPGATCLINVICYTPQGTFYALSIGQSTSLTNGLNLTHIYNNRLQPLEFKASSAGGNAIDISYSFVDPSTSKNAGHVYSITNNIDTTRSQTFAYDQLDRITSALTTSTHATSPPHCWGETYQYDGVTNGAWGNLTQIVATTNPAYVGCTQESGFSKTVDGNNHLSGFSYDLSGNTQNDGINAYTWDAESQLKTAAGVTYTYDGDGRRVSKVGSKLYWYGSGSEILAETDATTGNTTAEYIFFGGKRVAMLPASSTPIYYVEDLLGTSRVMTTNAGVVCYDADFYPFGVERPPYTLTCPQNNYKFEGKERDTETLNDNFGARYYTNRFGRWLSADWSSVPAPVPYANPINPQTLNLYAMVADDPESFADLDGHFPGNGGTSRVGECRNYEVLCTMEFYPAVGNSESQQAAENQQQNKPAQAQGQTSTAGPALNGPFVADLKSPTIAPLLDPNHKPSNSDIVGPNGECVDLTKKFSGMGDVGTFQWRAGPKVVDDKDTKPGTAIATFDSKGRYPQGDVPKNSGIYLGRGTNGSIWILDQWPARSGGQKVNPPQPRELLTDRRRGVSNDSNAYRVIYVAPR